MSDARDHARNEVIRYCRRLQAEHLVLATSGNVSARVHGEADVVAMTPTALAYDTLARDDICIVGTSGEVLDGRRQPTTELPLHRRVYARRPEVGAIIHTHSPAAMTMAVLGWRLPAILTGLVTAVGGDVPVAPYARPATAELADTTCAVLADRGACFLRHHGVLAVGADLASAFLAASAAEGAARVYLDARAQGVDVPELPPSEVAVLATRWQAHWTAARPASALA